MDRESVERLRFDRRLQRRRGLVEETERAAHSESLPDVSEKMTRGPAEEVEVRETRPDPGQGRNAEGLSEAPATTGAPSAFGTHSAGEPDPS